MYLPTFLLRLTLRFNRQQTRSNIRTLLMTILVLTLVLLANVTKNVNADSLSMPEENVNYTITNVEGDLWAKIDGTYPIHYNGSDESILMVYPTPPGTMNISIWLNDVKLDWNNFTEVSGETHHTAIGDWQMISTLLTPISESFMLRIHYEHPVQVINGSYLFLYDLNIASYLSALDNKSVCHYTVRMETEYANLKVNTVFGDEETLKPIAFTVSGANPAEIKIDEVSEFDKPLPGDLLISFSEPETKETWDTSWVFISVLVVGFIIAFLIVYGLLRRRRNRE